LSGGGREELGAPAERRPQWGRPVAEQRAVAGTRLDPRVLSPPAAGRLPRRRGGGGRRPGDGRRAGTRLRECAGGDQPAALKGRWLLETMRMVDDGLGEPPPGAGERRARK